jgi:hypothetical protein
MFIVVCKWCLATIYEVCAIANNLLKAIFLVDDVHKWCFGALGHFVGVYKLLEVVLLVIMGSWSLNFCVLIVYFN